MCEHVLVGMEDSRGTDANSPTAPVLVVPDVASDEGFNCGPGVFGQPFNRFYAGTPIRTRRGINIGVYCVFDDKPRAGLRQDEMDFLRDMAGAVMAHLESRRNSEAFYRAERMVRGIGSFVEGKATLSSTTTSFESPLGAPEGALNTKQQDVLRDSEQNVRPDVPAPRPGLASSQQPRPPVTGRPDVTACGVSSAASPGVASTTSAPAASGTGAGTSSGAVQDPQLVEIKTTFSRAANIIRESIEVEGVLFLDASVGTFGGLVVGSYKAKESDRSPGSRSDSSTSESRPLSGPSGEPGGLCNVFAFSTSDISSVDNEAPMLDHTNFPEQLLKRLLHRYPAGKIFNFDEDGAVQSSESELDGVRAAVDQAIGKTASRHTDAKETAAHHKISKSFLSRQNEAKAIIGVLKGATSVALVPIWDSNRERWFAGGLVWTNAPGRSFTVEGELSYLTAFGTTIMEETTRIAALLADKAKSDVLGSLSHELRSPLHGVIAGVELLHDTEINAFQADLIHTIETSGRTLLDTLDHVCPFKATLGPLLTT